MQVIPAIDLLDGKAVRLHKGSYEEVTVYNESPLKQAEEFAEAGFEHIHVVDLNGARSGSFINLKYVTQIIEELGISVQTGGGVRTLEDVQMLADAGLSGIICSSMAIKNEEGWLKALEQFPQKMILGMDLKDGKIAYGGWLETATESVSSFLNRMTEKGLKEVLCTDISRDGTLSGPNFELYEQLMRDHPEVRWIASGGVAELSDLQRLHEAKVPAVVVGKAYYEGKITLQEMAAFNR